LKELWVEKYRPSNIGQYVFRDEKQKHQVQSWVESGAIPHLLFSGSAGTGKTTLAKVLLKELGVDDGDVMFINASSENNVDTMRTKINGFASSLPFGGEFKYVLLDESDYLSQNAQAILRNMMETYSSTCRFILTCNYPNKVIPAIHSRCQGYHIEKLDTNEFTARVAEILITEGINPDLEILDVYVRSAYPDLRKCINMVQQNIVDGALQQPGQGESGESDWILEYVALFQLGKVSEARKLIVSKARAEEYEGVYRKLYENLDWFGQDDMKKGKALLCIRDGLVNHSLVADPEINLSATLLELQYIAK
jgi:DNA polymerase III delta prime subunit|tara:strand:- start:19264 stop:20190 length:927 start_codon:yes stop_codon:yes gene_type:complete